jgi:hypothetical protein
VTDGSGDDADLAGRLADLTPDQLQAIGRTIGIDGRTLGRVIQRPTVAPWITRAVADWLAAAEGDRRPRRRRRRRSRQHA